MLNFEYAGRPVIKSTAPLPMIFLTVRALQQIRACVDAVEHEVAFLGTVREIGNDLLVEEIFVVRQNFSRCHAILEADGILDLMGELAAQGPEGESAIERLRFWGQSHGNLSIGPSAVDDAQFNLLRNRPYYIMAVFNKSGKTDFTLHLAERRMIIENAEWRVYIPENAEISAAVAGEIAAKGKNVPTPDNILAELKRTGDLT